MGGKKHTIEDAKRICAEHSIEFLSDTFHFASDKYLMRCLVHNKVYEKRLVSVTFGVMMRCCANERIRESKTHTIDEVKNICLNNNFEYLEKTYKFLQDHAKFKCLNHNEIHISTFDNIKKGLGLKCCKKAGMTGPKNRNWNPDLTKEERESRRNVDNGEQVSWRKEVFKRDNYTCQVCLLSPKVPYSLNSHHIYNYKDFPSLRTDISNGICLCVDCHRKFHKEFGNYRNTKNQLVMFRQEFLNLLV